MCQLALGHIGYLLEFRSVDVDFKLSPFAFFATVEHIGPAKGSPGVERKRGREERCAIDVQKRHVFSFTGDDRGRFRVRCFDSPSRLKPFDFRRRSVSESGLTGGVVAKPSPQFFAERPGVRAGGTGRKPASECPHRQFLGTPDGMRRQGANQNAKSKSVANVHGGSFKSIPSTSRAGS